MSSRYSSPREDATPNSTTWQASSTRDAVVQDGGPGGVPRLGTITGRRRSPVLHTGRVMNARPVDILVGGAAGVVATVPMTLTMEALHRILPAERSAALPPREVTEGVYDYFDDAEHASERQLEQLTFALHYSFGGAAGALFPLVAPRRLPAAVGAGVLYGLGVWSVSYLGILPAIRVRHDATEDHRHRTLMMIAAHVVWGATLGLILRGRPGLRTASRHPDHTVDTTDSSSF